MNPNIMTLVAVLSVTAVFFLALARTVNGAANVVDALGNLCSALENFIIKFRRLMKVIKRRVRRR